MREIVMDTETTGLDPLEGHRILEIGCVELVNHLPSGRHLHLYINPERDVPAEVVAVHGLTEAFLADKPVFAEVYMKFIEFIGNAKLVIHNAEFDMKFLNHELKNVGHPELPMSRVVDTIQIARKKFPGSPANLDALCRRFNIDNSARELHGALLDSEILAEVYLELLGGRQHGLELAADASGSGPALIQSKIERPYREPRSFPVPEDEKTLHEQMLGQISEPIWRKSQG